MTQNQAALLIDTRLSREARILGLLISGYGDGEHEISHEEFRVALGRGSQGLAKDQTIAGYVQELTSHGWIARSPGGRGSPRYSFTPLQGVGKHPPLPTPESMTPLQGVGRKDSDPPLRGGHTPPSSSTPLPPPPPSRVRAREADVENSEIDPAAERAIADRNDLLNGCRGPLHDYLAERVDPGRQAAYVWRLVTSLEGADEWMWKDRTGKTLTEGRTGIIAAALNELMLGTEVGKHFPEAPGGFGNLRSKVRYLVASALGVERDAEKPDGRGPMGPKPPRRKHPTIDMSNQGTLD